MAKSKQTLPYRIERKELGPKSIDKYEFTLWHHRPDGTRMWVNAAYSNSPIAPKALRNTQARLNTKRIFG